MYTTAVAPPFGDWKKTGVKAGVKVTEPKKSPFSFKTKHKQVLVKKKPNKQKKTFKICGRLLQASIPGPNTPTTTTFF